MNRSRQLALVLIIATVIAAAGSHWVASWLKVKTIAAQPYTVGKPTQNPPAFLASSSVGGYGIAWGQIAAQLDTQIKTWGIAGGSPVEFEQFQKEVPEAKTTFIVISTYDLDEALTCDFRAAIVPLGQAITSLRTTHADWQYSRRVLSQYPMTWLRTLFPTLGRSRGLMGATLIKVKDLVKHSAATSETMAGPTINFEKGTAAEEYTQQRVSDWPQSQIIGKLVAMRVEFQGAHSFNGAKRLALEGMLQYAEQRGRAIVIVMPLSASYTKEFTSPALLQKFDDALAQVKQDAPGAEWLRLDQVPALASNENYCDLVHMNVAGQELATQTLQAWLKQPSHQP